MVPCELNDPFFCERSFMDNQNNIERIDRVKGCLIGGAVGDAFGLVAEFESAKSIKEKYGLITEMLSGGWLQTEQPGTISDDTENLMCVARSLVECKGYDAHDMAKRLVQWYEGDVIDIGKTIRAGLHRYAKTGELVRPGSHDQAGNGALMRIAPFALAGIPVEYAISHAHLTHNNLESDKAIECYWLMISAALKDADRAELASIAEKYYPNGWQPGEYDGQASGYVVHTMNTVLHCFFSTMCFEDAIISCCSYGQDADTNCSILGGLVGCHYGFAAIPDRWVKALDKEIFEKLLQIAEG